MSSTLNLRRARLVTFRWELGHQRHPCGRGLSLPATRRGNVSPLAGSDREDDLVPMQLPIHDAAVLAVPARPGQPAGIEYRLEHPRTEGNDLAAHLAFAFESPDIFTLVFEIDRNGRVGRVDPAPVLRLNGSEKSEGYEQYAAQTKDQRSHHIIPPA